MNVRHSILNQNSQSQHLGENDVGVTSLSAQVFAGCSQDSVLNSRGVNTKIGETKQQTRASPVNLINKRKQLNHCKQPKQQG